MSAQQMPQRTAPATMALDSLPPALISPSESVAPYLSFGEDFGLPFWFWRLAFHTALPCQLLLSFGFSHSPRPTSKPLLLGLPRSLSQSPKGETLEMQIYHPNLLWKALIIMESAFRRLRKCCLWRSTQKIKRWTAARACMLTANGIYNHLHDWI